METLGITHSVCEKCRRLVPAKIVTDGKVVRFLKFCSEHGESDALVSSDKETFLSSQRFVKPAWTPEEFSGDATQACPEGCGHCSRHEQHLCLPIIEITSRCNLQCPICLVNAGAKPWDMSLSSYEQIIEKLIRAERQINVLNLSGGEPLLHPDLLAIVDATLSHREIVRVSISTNGLVLLSDPQLLEELRARNVVISLQLDGFNDEADVVLRGQPLADQKLRLLDLLADNGISTSLTMTLAGGVNEDQLPVMLECLFGRSHISSLMIQPLAFAGRAVDMRDRIPRLTTPDVIALLGGAGLDFVSSEDFVPLPCSHPLCFSLAFYLMLDGGKAISFNRLVDTASVLDSISNQVFFGLNAEDFERLKVLVYDLWSGPAGSVPDSEAVLKTIREILREISCPACRDPRKVFGIGEERLKSIFIHSFQDAETFDLSRVRRCCNAYPLEDGRFVPVCARNVLMLEEGL